MNGARIFVLSFFMILWFITGTAITRAAEDTGYPISAQWQTLNGGEMNISVFIYTDRNRNGVYDLPDRPLVGIRVEMTGEQQRKMISSNSDGYSNFIMSATRQHAAIRKPGKYFFEVVPPRGWQITSDNGLQEIEFKSIKGSPGDLVADTVIDSVGLAPDLFIMGQLVEMQEGTTVTAEAPDGARRDVSVTKSGEFQIDAYPGDWLLDIRTKPEGTSVQRRVTVKDAPVVMSSIRPSSTYRYNKENAGHITFDDLTTRRLLKIPNDYGGLSWKNAIATEQNRYGGRGYKNGSRSGNYILYGSSGHPITMSHPKSFDFYGGYFSVAWPRAEGETLQLTAWRAGEIVASDAVRLNTFGPIWFDAQYRNISRLELKTLHYWQLVGDDFEIGFAQ
jgi:hypothetical protein